MTFVGAVVPDSAEFRTRALSIAGNTHQLSILRALAGAGLLIDEVLSFIPLPSYPADRRVFVASRTCELPPALRCVLLPFLNVMPIKTILIGCGVALRLLIWGLRHPREQKIVVTYNLSSPPGAFTFLAARLIRAKVVGLLFDVGIPGDSDPDTLLFRLNYLFAKMAIPRLDGRIVVTDAIGWELGRGEHYLRIDGGVELDQLEFAHSLPPGEDAEVLTVGYAGSLWPVNGVAEMLEAMRRLVGARIRLRIAGDGLLRKEVERAAAGNPQVEYLGTLSGSELKAFFRSCDALLNVRLTRAIRAPYLFPSKLMSYFAAGKGVVSTQIGHIGEYEEFCWFLEDETPKALATTLRHLISLGRRRVRDKGIAAHDFVRSCRTWPVQGQKMAEYIRHVAADKAFQ